jgi:alkylated DNA repair dioxygenase AlkB
MQVEEYNGTEDVFNLGSGDSYIIHNFFTNDEADDLFVKLHEDTNWGNFTIRNSRVPRLVSVQGDIKHNPIYRHPVDEHPLLEPWSEPTKQIKHSIEIYTKEKYNQALVQLYRDGRDFISPHSDKTLDIRHNTSIANISLGETRVLSLKSKDKTKKQEIKLLNGSLYVLGWKTNMEWHHSIRRNADPKAIVKPRISLTFRDIATFQYKQYTPVWGYGSLYGQGAKCKTLFQLKMRIVLNQLIFGLLTFSMMVALEQFDPLSVIMTYIITLISIGEWKKYKKRDDALAMFHLFSRMNKESDPEIFSPEEGYDALNYSEYI